MSYVARLDNRTPFEAVQLLVPDGEGGEAILVVVRAAFELGEDGAAVLSSTPAEIRMADSLVGPPGAQVSLGDADLALYKPRVDLILTDAVAHAPGGRPASQLFVELHVGHGDGADSSAAAHDASQVQLVKSALVSGDRLWTEDGASPPLPFERMPLDWTRAYGGTLSADQFDARNPLGVGWAGARPRPPEDDETPRGELPNVEDPRAPMARPDSPCAPLGFGYVARTWQPRLGLAGTFDASWKRTRWPLAPRDFDWAHHQCAQADQQLARYCGGEPVRLVNLTPEGEWLFRLPHLDVPLHLAAAEAIERAELRVDTVEIETAARRVSLTARAAIPIARKRAPIEAVILGHLKPGWLRARASGKTYVDLQGHAGTDLARPCYW